MSYLEKRWYVFYTYPKFERKIQTFLQEKGYEVFLPLHWEVRQWSDRKKRLLVPLFPNYIFVKIERHRIYEILNVPKIVSCVKFNGNPASLKQEEVDCIKFILDSAHNIEKCDRLKVGDSVMITEGTLTGLMGILEEERGNHRFALRLETIQQSLLVEVHTSCLEYSEAFI